VDELSCSLLAVPYRTSLAGTAEERNPGIVVFLYFQVLEFEGMAVETQKYSV
jgi:hypothetical protein